MHLNRFSLIQSAGERENVSVCFAAFLVPAISVAIVRYADIELCSRTLPLHIVYNYIFDVILFYFCRVVLNLSFYSTPAPAATATAAAALSEQQEQIRQ